MERIVSGPVVVIFRGSRGAAVSLTARSTRRPQLNPWYVGQTGDETMATDKLELVPDTIRIFVDDALAARSFYREALGLPLRDGSPEQGYLVFHVGSLGLLVEAVDAEDDESSGLVGRLVGLSFRVRDIERAHSDLMNRGVVFVGAPERQPWGGILAHFRDPAGNVLTLVEHPLD
jgi:catechol 2,3-dioxygenase-like lactoylglutathione lyase family enzyme